MSEVEMLRQLTTTLNYNHPHRGRPSQVVTQLPLCELWRDDGLTTTARGKSLTFNDVREFLALGTIEFVVADVGVALRWIPASECFDFWKNEVKPHLASGRNVALNEFPGRYCYFASLWKEGAMPIVLLEKHH
jgi:hypothetical protein